MGAAIAFFTSASSLLMPAPLACVAAGSVAAPPVGAGGPDTPCTRTTPHTSVIDTMKSNSIS